MLKNRPALKTLAERVAFQKWVRAETLKLEAKETVLSTNLREQILKAWKAYHPQMLNDLEAMGLSVKFADLMQAKMWEAQEAYSAAGMRWPDSLEQAQREFLMMYPQEASETTT